MLVCAPFGIEQLMPRANALRAGACSRDARAAHDVPIEGRKGLCGERGHGDDERALQQPARRLSLWILSIWCSERTVQPSTSLRDDVETSAVYRRASIFQRRRFFRAGTRFCRAAALVASFPLESCAFHPFLFVSNSPIRAAFCGFCYGRFYFKEVKDFFIHLRYSFTHQLTW